MTAHPPSQAPQGKLSPSLTLGLCLLWALLWYLPSPPILLTPDAISIFNFAECITSRSSTSAPAPCIGAAHWQPGQAIAVAFLHALGMRTATAARWIALFSGAFIVVPLYVLGRWFGGESVGKWAAALSVPSAVLRFHALIPEARLSALTLTLGAWAGFVLFLETRKRTFLLAAGASAALASVWRPEGKLTLVLLSLMLIGDHIHRFRIRGPKRAEKATLMGDGLATLGGAAGVLIPTQLFVSRLLPKGGDPGRTWELLAGTWIPLIKTPLFAALFGFGDRPTPFRTRLRQALAAGDITIPPTDALHLLLGMMRTNVPNMPGLLPVSVGIPLLACGVLGITWLLRDKNRRRRLIGWSVLILPVVPLAFLAQTYNPILPESNLLFMIPALLLPAATLLDDMLRIVARRSRWAAWSSGVIILSLSFAVGRTHYLKLVDERTEQLFEGRLESRAAGLWLARHTPPDAEVYTTWVGTAIAYHGGRRSRPWPSSWEIPALMRSLERTSASPPLFLVITSVDAFERPLELNAWLEQSGERPDWAFYLQGKESPRWTALLPLKPGRTPGSDPPRSGQERESPTHRAAQPHD